MKIEIEITEEMLRNAMAARVDAAVLDLSTAWATEEYIMGRVKAAWHSVADRMISEALDNSQAMREKIAKEVERKLRAQIVAAMKAADRA